MRRVPLILALAALCACRSVPAPDHGGIAAMRSPTTRPAVIHGRASHLEQMLSPAGAVLEVQLIDDGMAEGPIDAHLATVAHMRYGDLRGPPYTFDLPYDPARISASGHYSLRAALRTAQGRLAFATAARVAVDPGASDRVELRLVRIAIP